MSPETEETVSATAEENVYPGADPISPGHFDASSLPLTQAINYLQHTIEKLNMSLARIDDMHDLRYRNLQLELQNISVKLDAKASQQSVDEMRGDVKTVRSSVDLVLETLKRRPE